MATSRQLAAIMFTDVAGFTELAQTDERGALGFLDEIEGLAQPVLAKHHGRRVKSMGDGLLVEFPDALDAVECAVELQRSLHRRNTAEGSRPLRLRIGLHLGDVQRKGDDIVGDAVNLASRVEPLADPGGVCLSGQVEAQVRNKVPFRMEKLGAHRLKGVLEPVEIFRVVLPWTSSSPAGSAAGTPRLAILPLTNISPDANDEYFADGLTEELISVLSRLRGLRVIARTSVSQYKAAPKPIRQVGAELGVGSVLEGSVRRAGERLRITLQLIDVGTEEHRWAATYDRELSDVFEIQAEVAEKTAQALQVELLGPDKDALRRPPTTDLTAYELYLRGIVAFQQTADRGWSRSGFDESARLFEAAIARDPAFASAYAYLANLCLANMGESIPASEVSERIRELVASGFRLNPRDPEVRTARGNYALQLEQNWARAEEEFRAALEMNPSAMSAHAWLGILYVTLGRYPDAVRELGVASELDPIFRTLTYWRLRAMESGGDLDGAFALAESAVERDPADRYLRVHVAGLLLRRGRVEEARRALVHAAGPLGGAGLLAARAELWAALGDSREAQALVQEWESGSSSMFVRPGYRAGVYLALGAKEKALETLEQDARDGERSLWIDFRRHSFDPLRNDPRFVALVRAMNLPD